MKKLTLVVLAVLFFAFPAFAQDRVEDIVKKARDLMGDEKPVEAAAEISKAIAIEPQNPDLYITRAGFYFHLENRAEILKDAQRAAALAPTDRKILYFAALILQRSQQHKEALKISDELMALGDVDRFGWGLRVQIKTHLQDFFGAFEDAATAIELFPEDANLRQNQANLVRLMGNSDKALEMYNSLIAAGEKKLAKTKDENQKVSLNRSQSMFLFSRAGLNFSKFSREQALADLIKAVEYLPEGSSYFQRARIYRDQKMFAEAVADFSKILEANLNFDKSLVYLERGDTYFFSQKYTEAVADYEEAVKLNESMREFTQKRIAQIKQKTAETNQPK